MAIAGIIAEYNPFHNGHAYMLRTVKEQADAVVVVMSGAFVQRGEPAVFSKRKRVEMALEAGADMVLELPLRGVLSSAQGFARAGVDVLCATGVVDRLCFGSECGDAERLKKVAQALQNPELDELIKQELSEGISYPAARQKALERYCADASLLQNPNDLLAIEYLLAVNGRLAIQAIPRIGAPHDGKDGATACRHLLKQGQSIERLVPQTTASLLDDQTVFLDDMERAVLARLRGLDAGYFAKVCDVSEGLENKIVKAIQEGCSWDDVVERIKSKRYTRSRICRILMRAYLDVTDPYQKAEYIRVLGFRKSSSWLLRQMRESARLPIVQQVATDGEFITLQEEMIANDRWGAFAPCITSAGEDYCHFPVVKE